jgi:DNA recombination protein RmuC
MEPVLLIVILLLLIIAVVLLALLLRRRPGAGLEQLQQSVTALADGNQRVVAAVKDEIATNRKESNDEHRSSRLELAESMKALGEALRTEIEKLTATTETKLETVKTSVEEKLTNIREDNSAQLDRMRATVDEKLHETLEKRLGESFKLVSERLELVHKGLGEMQSLAIGVGDLKRVLTNVKTRGTWGEVQLGALLEQILTADQYGVNVATKGTAERVDFAVKLPGKDGEKDDIVWLPIDAKFPIEDYQRLLEAQERGDIAAVEAASKQLDVRIRASAKDISEKYLDPPHTTDFGILYLPTEGLFAEALRRPGLAEYVQREMRVSIAGPTTLLALLNSLQMGFRTLAIEKRSSEVWKLLAGVKTEWAKFNDVLDKVHKKLDDASKTIDSARTRTRAIGRKLHDVQALPVGDGGNELLVAPELDDSEDDGENEG